jgi:hypothetical protein
MIAWDPVLRYYGDTTVLLISGPLLSNDFLPRLPENYEITNYDDTTVFTL